jgi:hypothetical protein
MSFSGDNTFPDKPHDGGGSDNEDISPNIQLLDWILDGMNV